MTKEKSLLFFFTLTHTLIISFKGNNILLSPFYFLFHEQFFLLAVFSLSSSLLGTLSILLCDNPCYCSLFSKVAVPYSLLPLVFLPSENPFSLLVLRSIFPLPIGRTLGPKPSNSL